MKFIIPSLIIISLLILTVGCSKNNVQPEEVGKTFIGGDKGLDLQFIEGAPPDVVYDKDFPFDINVKVENKGEWDISDKKDLTLTIIGIEPASFGKTLEDLIKNSDTKIDGAGYDAQGNIKEGTITNINFPNLQYQQDVVGTIELPIVAKACYEYGTKVNSKICILDDLLGTTRRAGENPVCLPTEEKKVENSGAPVQITSFKESAVASDKISFTFVIEHIGEGSVSRKDTECNSQIADKDKIYVKINTGLDGLTCSGLEGSGSQGFTTLFGKKRIIICTQELQSPRGDFEKPIDIELEYGYSQITAKTMQVRHIG